MRGGWAVAACLVCAAACAGPRSAVSADASPEAPVLVASEDAGVTDLPPIPTDGYTTSDAGYGGYQLGPRLAPTVTTVPATGPSTCNTLRGIVRDFKGALPAWGGSLQPGGHPDFEVFEGRGLTHGLVKSKISPERKPVYDSHCELGAPVSATCPFGAMTTSAENFGQWYTSAPGVNQTFLVYFQLVPRLNVYTFASYSFFPLDGKGWGDSGMDIALKVPHNYSFTTEIHTTFRYNGGEVFTFQGDDDVWIFINDNLAVDLGGLHELDMGVQSVDLDQQAAALQITKGSAYRLDLFHAERHSVNSDFRIDLNFAFEDCGYIAPNIVP